MLIYRKQLAAASLGATPTLLRAAAHYVEQLEARQQSSATEWSAGTAPASTRIAQLEMDSTIAAAQLLWWGPATGWGRSPLWGPRSSRKHVLVQDVTGHQPDMNAYV
jgi:hypothetical protein